MQFALRCESFAMKATRDNSHTASWGTAHVSNHPKLTVVNAEKSDTEKTYMAFWLMT